jgi:hypothetical protein
MANLDLVPFAGYISDDSDFYGTLPVYCPAAMHAHHDI